MTGVDTVKGFHQGEESRGGRGGQYVSALADMAGIRLPLESHPLQALVSEPIKPVVNTVIMSNAVHAYISQSDKGDLVIGAGVDQYTGFGQRGSFHIIEGTLAGDRRNVPGVLARADEPAVGRHCGRFAGCVPDHQQDRREGPVLQLRLGHGRLQGDAGFGLGVCPHHRATTHRIR